MKAIPSFPCNSATTKLPRALTRHFHCTSRPFSALSSNSVLSILFISSLSCRPQPIAAAAADAVRQEIQLFAMNLFKFIYILAHEDRLFTF
uniref:Uncharacterized protein n=1 Tax=Caenorhabditis tropicalis TaxID=1561998 RepID=A0A1I7T949_9PELO